MTKEVRAQVEAVALNDSWQAVLRTKEELRLRLEQLSSRCLNAMEELDEQRLINSCGVVQGTGADVDRLVGKYCAQAEAHSNLARNLKRLNSAD